MHRLSSAVPSKQLEDPHLVFLASDLRYAVPHIRILLKIETVFFLLRFQKEFAPTRGVSGSIPFR